MMTIASEITPGTRVFHAEYGNGTVEFVVTGHYDEDGNPEAPHASVVFDGDDSGMFPTLDSLEIIAGGVEIPSVPSFAKLVGYAAARPMSRHGIRPVALFHFNIDGEGPFVVSDGELHMPCHRCKGWGEYSQNEMDGTMCYGCNGDGLGKSITWADAERIAKRRAAERKRVADKARAEMLATAYAFDAFVTDNRAVYTFLIGEYRKATGYLGTGFLPDMIRRVLACETLSPNMIAAVERIIGARVERTATRVAAGHVGTVGKRETFEVQIVNVRALETAFGPSYLVIMVDRNGASLKTFGTGEWAANAEKSDAWISIKATVKAHEEYRGEPQTVLTRVAAA